MSVCIYCIPERHYPDPPAEGAPTFVEQMTHQRDEHPEVQEAHDDYIHGRRSDLPTKEECLRLAGVIE